MAEDAQIVESLDVILGIRAGVYPKTVNEVLSGSYDGSDAHYKFVLWCKMNKEMFWAACILGGATDNDDIHAYYLTLIKPIN